MPSFPRLSRAADAVQLSLFARLYERLGGYRGDVISLQVGDTYLTPPAGARLCQQPFDTVDDRELYAYAPPAGWGPLIDAVRAKVEARNGFAVGPAGVQITCGATHALSCAVGALLDPGDELILLTPHWPLIRGITQTRSAVPVEAPFTMPLLEDPAADPAALIRRHLGPRTAGIYLSSPNNPDGVVLGERELAAVIAVAAEANLWILADEVYEDYVYDGHRHLSIASLPGGAERTVTVYSFSKSFAQAGLRVGYAVGPEPLVAALRKMANHSVYNVPQALQRAALAALTGGDAFLADARTRYAAARDAARARLQVPTRSPQGSTYLWLDLRRWGDDILERIAEAGVLLAPGAGFGQAYAGWARLCFTAVDPDRLAVGIDRINAVLAASPTALAAGAGADADAARERGR
ncbi:MAG: pyridoxal phosphate-dependent aminotransferase [Kofleriaceae bacterium]|nr:pyridoxal phosphate-dependent aminotransferase [Kofleriaceae bacterium]